MEDPFQVDELGLPLFLGNPHIWMCSWDLAGLILAWYLVNMWLIFVYFWLIFGEYVADICSFVVEFGEYVADIGEDLMKNSQEITTPLPPYVQHK